VEETTSCTRCGTKFAGSRDRCPKCRTLVPQVDPAAEAARSRRLQQISAALVAIFLLIIGGLWMMREPEPDESAMARAAVRNPLAERRRAMARSEEPTVAAPTTDAERPFLEAAGKGSIAYNAGDYASALARYEEAVKQNPQDAESLSNLGQVLVRLQRTAEALPYFERATALNPNRWAYRFNLARAQGLLQHWDEAIASYRQAQTLFPDDYATTFNLARALHKKGDDTGAVVEYKKAIALNPGDASFRMALAISYEALQQKSEAAGQYVEYLRLSPLAADADKVRAKIAQLTASPAPPAAPATPPAGT
jgi:tetratricopeptide (TPR) repeat protein